jgi:hypothetical protein
MVMTANDLAIWFIRDIQCKDVTHFAVTANVKKLKALRDRGITSDQIRQYWIEWKKNNPEPKFVDIDKPWAIQEEKAPEPNLLTSDKYLHPKFMTSPPPIKSYMDENGEVHHVIEDFSPTRIESFTIDDLLMYYYSKFPMVRQSPKRDRGGLEYLLKLYGLVKLMFIIDAAKLHTEYEDARPPRSPVEITDWEEEGIKAYNEKMNY